MTKPEQANDNERLELLWPPKTRMPFKGTWAIWGEAERRIDVMLETGSRDEIIEAGRCGARWNEYWAGLHPNRKHRIRYLRQWRETLAALRHLEEETV